VLGVAGLSLGLSCQTSSPTPVAFISRQFGLACAEEIHDGSYSSPSLDSNSGSLAMLAAIRRASSRVSTFA
jgi:hypothetical protein